MWWRLSWFFVIVVSVYNTRIFTPCDLLSIRRLLSARDVESNSSASDTASRTGGRGVRLLQYDIRHRLPFRRRHRHLRDSSVRPQWYSGRGTLRDPVHAQLRHWRSLPAEPRVRWSPEVLDRRQYGVLRRSVWLRRIPQGHLSLCSGYVLVCIQTAKWKIKITITTSNLVRSL